MTNNLLLVLGIIVIVVGIIICLSPNPKDDWIGILTLIIGGIMCLISIYLDTKQNTNTNENGIYMR